MKKLTLIALMGLMAFMGSVSAQDNLAGNFVRPPDSARPWVYWFWLNGNITREGITADLEAMKRAGIGGVLIMEVDQGAPRGPVDFAGPRWRELFKHAVAEAGRLGLEINMNDDAGWNGSGGPWIKPEQSMQKVVWTETELSGPRHFDGKLPQAEANHGFYRGIAVLAFPTPGDYRIPDIKFKALYERREVPAAAETQVPPEMAIAPARLTDLTARLDKDGRLAWDVPAGKWTIMRLGHTGTGVENAPAPATGRGLECDKLSREGIEAQFAGLMAKLIADAGPAAGKALVATHIDSWENGAQNWTARMREEFRARRGYDPIPFLPAISGRVVDSLEVSERFLWDLRQTVTDLLVENYAGHMATLAHEHGLRLSIEAYGGPCDDITYGGRADEPMGEFWIGGGAFETLKQMASSAHLYGRRILGAESFTADDHERWLQHPGTIKSLGDKAFCEGVNRFVFHRYAMQPWLGYRPGMAMGPWGLHYERTSTLWETSRPWHEYLARCQYLLRQGVFVADICYLQPEAAPQEFKARNRKGYDYDTGTAEALLARMSVKDGRIMLPDGMSYRVLVLPETARMTPALLRKVKEMVSAGATVIGSSKPAKSPGLSGYPACDAEVKQLADEMWGKGRIVADKSPEQVLAGMGAPPDFTAPPFIRWVHRSTGDAEIYFVASGAPRATEALCAFRVTGRRPEFWQPETGKIEAAAAYEQAGDVTRIPIRFEPSGSVFVVFRKGATSFDPVVRVTLDGRQILPPPEAKGNILIEKAVYGVPGDPKRTRDVRAKLQAIVDGGELSFRASRMAEGDDPALNVEKTLVVDYTVAGKRLKASGRDPETMTFESGPGARLVAGFHAGDSRLSVEAWEPGRYELTTAAGRKSGVQAPVLPPALEITGPWEVRFPPNGGAPERVIMEKLISWSEHPDPGVRHFSGTAACTKKISVPRAMIADNQHVYLDLGKVQVMAQVKLNGRDLGILWKSPYVMDVTGTLKAGDNDLEIRVTNLWVNRLIGDEQLPEDSDRNPDGTLKAWPKWVINGNASPTGRFTFTSWRLWKKNDPLVESGLVGPVTLRVSEQVSAR
ncbi:MAG: glycosyl hydrolase [Candidatus Aminicenantales bacterium]